ncbi:hypothetical protein EVAR_75376_1 [Eumeta japonica]|uniref:Uncharacterized protein n=1 Tax=Eumeta variegata TaxID=151549 RepID=A0A4C1YE82_EUMVA|nr:hypothetical protein EVAR_75376_1 [Eumeta japonica]
MTMYCSVRAAGLAQARPWSHLPVDNRNLVQDREQQQRREPDHGSVATRNWVAVKYTERKKKNDPLSPWQSHMALLWGSIILCNRFGTTVGATSERVRREYTLTAPRRIRRGAEVTTAEVTATVVTSAEKERLFNLTQVDLDIGSPVGQPATTDGSDESSTCDQSLLTSFVHKTECMHPLHTDTPPVSHRLCRLGIHTASVGINLQCNIVCTSVESSSTVLITSMKATEEGWITHTVALESLPMSLIILKAVP